MAKLLMRLSNLRDAKVKTVDGKTLGRVHDVHVEGWRVVALACGAGSFLERLTGKNHGRRIAWECVKRVSHKEVLVVADPPQSKVRPAAARSRQGTRRPSAQQSKR